MEGWCKMLRGVIIIAAAFFSLAGNAAAQQRPTPQSTNRPEPEAEPDEVVVEGYRQRSDIETSVANSAAVSAARNRQRYEYSERIARCAARNRLTSFQRLRAVVDGEFNTPTHRLAQDRLKRIYIACSESVTLLSFSAGPQSDLAIAAALGGDMTGITGETDTAPLGRSIYDRGAFTAEALKMFEPGLRLTRAQTTDRAVQSRFNLREMPRNRFRLPLDRRYFEVAVCMVRVEPRLSVRLAMSEGPARLADVQAALIDRARICVGDAKQVQVDPTEFRLYIADAVYRWAVAARGVESLIPAA